MSSHLNPHHFLLSSSVDIGAICPRQIPNTWITPTMVSEMSMVERSLAPSPNESSELSIQGKKFRHTTIEMVPEDILLEIFDFYRLHAMKSSRGKPWKWQRLAHVCRKWRHVLSVSPRRLQLQIYCISRGSIGSILATWPSFPLVVRFKSPKGKTLPSNLIIALRHSDRICDIDLMVPSSIIGPIVEAIQVPFPELVRIRILVKSKDCTGTPVLSTLLGGSAPRLKEIGLDGVVVPFPALRQLLLSTINLTLLRLENITSAGYFAPDALISVLLHPALARLRILNLHFRLSAFRITTSSARPPPLARETLSSLTSLFYRGIPDYLEEFVAKIDTPALMTIRVTFYNQLIFNVQEICKFLSRMDRSKFAREVVLRPSAPIVWIELRHQKRGSHSWECNLGILCRQLEWQLSSATQILSQLFDFLPKMDKLGINTFLTGPDWKEDDVDLTQWLELFQLFPDLFSLTVSEQFVPGITHALVTEDMATEVLPTLRTLTLRGYRKSPSVAEAAEKFAAMRKLSGHQLTLCA